MKKMLVSAIVVAGILGGDYWALPQMNKVTDVSTSQKAQSADHSATTVKRTVKKSPTKAVIASGDTNSDAHATSQQAVTATSTSSTAAKKKQSSATTKLSGSQAGQSTTAATSSKSVTTTGAASSATTAGQDLSATQIDNWVWQQVAPQYQNTSLTQRDFAFYQYNTGGLVYVEVYENQNADVAHLAGRFRINNYGQLERQSMANPDHWQVVSTDPAH